MLVRLFRIEFTVRRSLEALDGRSLTAVKSRSFDCSICNVPLVLRPMHWKTRFRQEGASTLLAAGTMFEEEVGTETKSSEPFQNLGPHQKEVV